MPDEPTKPAPSQPDPPRNLDLVPPQPKPDAQLAYDLAPESTPAPLAKAPPPLGVQEANRRLQEAERREEEQREQAKREEATLDGKPLTEPLVSMKLTGWRTMAYVGAGVLLLALIMTYVHSERSKFVFTLITLYGTLLHSLLALGALRLQAMLEERPMGNWREALARFFVCMATFHVLLHLPFKTSYEWLNKGVLALVACAGFLACVMLLFRWPIRRALMVGGLQVLIWIALTAHLWLRSLITPVR